MQRGRELVGVASAFAEAGPEGRFRTDHRFDVDRGRPGCGCSRGCRHGDGVPLAQAGPEAGRAGDHRLNRCSTGLNSGGLAAHQLHGEGGDDERAQETCSQGDGTAAAEGNAAGHGVDPEIQNFSMGTFGVNRYRTG